MSWPSRSSFARVADCSVSNSTNAIPLRVGTRRTSLNPGNLNSSVIWSMSYSLGNCRINRVLFGCKYSSGTTPGAFPADALRPLPRAVLSAGSPSRGSPSGAGRFLSSSASSSAFFRSTDMCQSVSDKRSSKSHLSLPIERPCGSQVLQHHQSGLPWHRSWS